MLDSLGIEGTLMSAENQEYGLSSWTCEFQDRGREQEFRNSVAEHTASDLRIASWVCIGLIFLVMLFDLQTRGVTESEYLLIAIRSVLVGGLLVLILRSCKNPGIAVQGYFVSVLEVVAFLKMFLLHFVHPESLVYTVVATMLFTIAIFVALPNRLLLAMSVALFGALGTIVCGIVLGASLEIFVALLISLSMPIGFGYLAARRLHLTQRRQFALLSRAKDANSLLSAEIERRKLLEHELKVQAITDPLTGLFNRRHFESLFRREKQRAARLNSKLSLCLVDLDHFKSINDEHGHEIGDKVLQAVSKLFLHQLRETDITGRFGGEEFVLLLPDASITEAQLMVNRLRESLADLQVKFGNSTLQVTATFGVTEVNAKKDNLTSAIRIADKALYAGKDAGRNRVMVANQ